MSSTLPSPEPPPFVKPTEDHAWTLRQDSPGFWSTQRLMKAVVVLIFLLAGAISIMFYQQGQQGNQLGRVEDAQKIIQKSLDDGKERGFVSRAKTCQVQVALAIPLDQDCLDPQVTKYYNPKAAPTTGANSSGQVANRALLCDILKSLGEVVTECNGS